MDEEKHSFNILMPTGLHTVRLNLLCGGNLCSLLGMGLSKREPVYIGYILCLTHTLFPKRGMCSHSDNK